jgi:hypothetical protein
MVKFSASTDSSPDCDLWKFSWIQPILSVSLSNYSSSFPISGTPQPISFDLFHSSQATFPSASLPQAVTVVPQWKYQLHFFLFLFCIRYSWPLLGSGLNGGYPLYSVFPNRAVPQLQVSNSYSSMTGGISPLVPNPSRLTTGNFLSDWILWGHSPYATSTVRSVSIAPLAYYWQLFHVRYMHVLCQAKLCFTYLKLQLQLCH